MRIRTLFLFACILVLTGLLLPQAAVQGQPAKSLSQPEAALQAAAATATTAIPVQTVTPNPDGSLVHQVQPGQTLWSIAIAYGIKVDQLIAYNNLKPTPVIFAGQKLLIRPAFTPTMSPTVTDTPRPPTRTPVPTYTPAPPTPTATRTLRPTPTRPPVLPALPALGSERRRLGIAIIVVCALGVLLVSIFSLRSRK